ncbi:MAG TPA: hypothetical protein VGD52_24075 [Pseudoduganella sp.]
MSYRSAAESAFLLACEEEEELSKLGLALLSELADKECYLARLCLMYLYDSGGVVERNPTLAQEWADSAAALHSRLTNPDDLYDAGLKCRWDKFRFNASDEDALHFWGKSAALGNGVALFAICDMTRHVRDSSGQWVENLKTAARLGSTEAMVELAEQEGVRGTHQETVWLRAAAALGSLRAKEMLNCED